MAALTLKNLPDDVLAELRESAAQNQRSINQQALYLLKQGLKREASGERPNASGLDTVTAWRDLCGAWRSDEPTQREVARIYRRRTRGRKVTL